VTSAHNSSAKWHKRKPFHRAVQVICSNCQLSLE
jgi:hypothetical protein